MASRMALKGVVAVRAAAAGRRALHSTSLARAVVEFKMPSMSPTMESGKISSWKVKDGEKFAAGDVLLTVETDKAEVDVEAQDDGVMGKIILDEKETNIQVGKTIALLAEEGDDISNLEVPAEASSSPSSPTEASSSSDSSSSSSSSSVAASPTKKDVQADPVNQPTPAAHGSHSSGPKHSRTILPSVHRLLSMAGINDASDIPGTGLRGQLTKGDVLKHLGKVQNVDGTAAGLKAFSEKMDKPKDANKGTGSSSSGGAPAKQAEQKILTGPEFRRWIASGMAVQTKPKPSPASAAVKPSFTFDDILDGYLSSKPVAPASVAASMAPTSAPRTSAPRKDSFDEILRL